MFGKYSLVAPVLVDQQVSRFAVDSASNMQVTRVTANPWSYAAAAGGIVNSTVAVTIKAAAGTSLRNYVSSISMAHGTLGGTVEVAIRDGAGGTVLWRGWLNTTAVDGSSGAGSIMFDPPLRSTANTLLEFVVLTAVTGGVYFNAQGFVGP